MATLTRDGLDLHYEVTGSGPALSFRGHDHNGMLDHLNEALPSVLAWFDEVHRV